jgi:pilus assembly protein CpaE
VQEPPSAPQLAQPIVVVGAHDLEATIIRRQLDGVAEIVAFVPDAEKAMEVIREKRPSLVILFMDHERDGVLALARQLVPENVPSVMVSRDRNPDTILLAMRSGARDFAYLEGADNDIRRAVSALASSTSVAAPQLHRGTVVAVFGCKGGCGATTLATNIAGALIEGDEHRRVVILDVDAQMGDVLTFLDVASTYSWADLLRNLPRLDDELVHRSLTAHASGLRVVAQGTEVEEADHIDAAAVTQTIGFLRQHYDFVIVDGIRDFRENALAALDAADRIAVTMTQDVPSLKNASRCLGVFRRLGYRPEKLKLIVNRYHKRDKLDLDTISDALAATIHATVSNDYPTVVRSINEGALLVKLAPHASVTDDIREVLPALELAPREEKRHWFGRRR